MSRKLFYSIMTCFLLVFIPLQMALPGTTGKIAGRITDKETGEPLSGANILIEATNMGAAADLDGYYTILHIPPGTYSVKISMIGYAAVSVNDVRVRIDQTARIDIALESEVIQGEEITVIADRNIVKDDVATSVVAITDQEMETLPLTDVNEVVGLQAGIEDGLVIRGGQADEALFQLNGFTLRDPRNNEPISGIALSAIKELSIERGGFNAEYGQVRSGVINVVTKEGGKSEYFGTLTLKASPPAAKHFGISPFDENSMWLRPYLDDAVCWTGTANGEPFTDTNGNGQWDSGETFTDYNGDGSRTYWDEYEQRQYPAFDGWTAISENTLNNTDPSDDLSPAAAQKLFLWEHRRRPKTDQPDYNIDAGFGGPVPFVGEKLGNLRFFTSYRREREMMLVPLARDDYLDYNWSLQLTSDLSSSMKLSMTGLLGKSYHVAINDGDEGYITNEFGPNDSRLYNYWHPTDYLDSPLLVAKSIAEQRDASRMFSDAWYCPAEVGHYSFGAKLVQTLSPSDFYEVSIEHIGRRYASGPLDDRDTTKIQEIVPGYWVDEGPFGYNSDASITGIGDPNFFFGGHSAEARDSSRISATTLKFNYTNQINFHNLVKIGLEFVYNDLKLDYGQINQFTKKIILTDQHITPYRGALYIQDKIEAEGFILNVGLRMDFSNANTDWVNTDIFNPEYFSTKYDPAESYNSEKAKTDLSFSPRLGISHPITENSKLFFNYGHFKQLPTYEELLRIGRSAGGSMQNWGDPNLSLAKTISYELGYDHVLFNTLLIQTAAFYHDITDQQAFTTYVNALGSIGYNKANSNNYEDIRGFELSLRKTDGEWWTGFANYTYQVSSYGYYGRQIIFEDPTEQRNYDMDTRNLYQRKPLPQPYGRISLSFYTPDDFGPNLMGMNLLSQWSCNMIHTWRAGEFIDWNPSNRLDVYDNIKTRDYHNTTLRLNKTIPLKGMKLTFFVDVNNLFNYKRLSGASFYDGFDYLYYMESLHLPESSEYVNIVGNDRAGDFRDEGVAFQPIEPVGTASELQNPSSSVIYYEQTSQRYMNYANGQWSEVDSGRMKEVLDSKAYIDMPNQSSFNFLNPRQWFFGIRMSFDID